jgi:pimeloyl-ACP methyl ester carboxylesterase
MSHAYLEDTDIPTEKVSWHSNEIVFRRCGDGPPVFLLHGIAGSFDTWNGVLPALGKKCYAVAPDLLGHGRSAKPRGDYSLGAYATGLRDLMEALEIPSATIVGHSLGGGIAMQFAYQYPKRCQRLVLVDSGGLGPEVTSFLRAATLPGAALVLSAITSERARNAGRAAWRRLQRAGVGYRQSAQSVANHLFSLNDKAARRAFIATARSVMDWRGQRIDATDRLYLAGHLPTMIVWGGRDRFIPIRHGAAAHDMIPGSRFEVFEEAGHFPHEEEPERFSELLLDFIETTEAAEISVDILRDYAMQDVPSAWEPPASP